MGYVADVFDERRCRELPGHLRDRPRALFDGRREQARERAAVPDRLRARADRHLPQRQPRQRARAARRARAAGLDLPATSSDTEVVLHLYARSKARIGRGRARRIGRAGAGRVLARAAHEGSPDRGARSARLPAARARPARRCLGRLLGNLRDGSDRRHLRARRRAGRSAGHQRRRAAVDQAVPAAPLAHCVFEHVYFARPDSYVFGRASTRSAPSLGRILAREAPVDADVVVPIPDSGVCAAIGLRRGGRTPAADGAHPQSLRRAHLHPAAAVDPPLRRQGEAESGAQHPRGQARRPGGRFDRARHDEPEDREDGARPRARSEVHVRISCPPTISPCFYGVDTPRRAGADRARRTRSRRSGSTSRPTASAT